MCELGEQKRAHGQTQCGRGFILRKTVLSYPFKDPADFGRLKVSWLRHLIARYESWKVLRRRKRITEDAPLVLHSPGSFRPLQAHDIPVVFLCHNDLRLLPAFLQHYRALGATRFIVVDDQSSDGSREWLAEQTDVDLWFSSIRYKDARRGRLWRERLFAQYGEGRWYVNVDADEFLVYDQYERRDLPALIALLTSQRVTKMAAPMLDLYPVGDLASAGYQWEHGHMPWDVADNFDVAGYKLILEKRCISIRGGPRQRMFGAEVEMMKYPLLLWSPGSSLGASIHQPLPFEDNFSPLAGVLLHFKFFADLAEKLDHAVADSQYFDDAREYKKIAAALKEQGELDFVGPHTVRYTGPDQLIGLGFMCSLGSKQD